MTIIVRDIGNYPEMTPRFGWEFWWDNNEDEDRYERLSQAHHTQSFASVDDAVADAKKFKALVAKAEIVVEE